jgi:hypothetical protein
MRQLKLCSLLVTGVALLHAADAPDPYCPAYPSAMRTEIEQGIQLDREFQTYSKAARARRSAVNLGALGGSNSLIDQAIARKMTADSVEPAPRTTDTEFLRRIYLDLSGRIPTPAQSERFLNSTDPAKRAKLIDELLAAPAYADQFALFLANRFKVTRTHESISTPARTVFYDFVHDLFARDRRYDEFVRDLIISAGEVDSSPGTQFFARWMDVNGPIQDSWDDTTEKITTSFLGYKTECISCHNGRAHLEKINLHLSRRSRAEFWRMSAFLSRMYFVRWSDDPIGFRPRIILADRDYGTYSGNVPPTNPGCRPPRIGAVVTPAFFTTGQEPKSGNWRTELAWMVTTDRQFARAAANYLWSYFFGYGIVDPPDAWDLDRVDPKAELPPDWVTQNSNPELLESLADLLIQNNYRLQPLIRQIVNSETYQLSARYTGQWKPAYVRYFARHEARRLSAEQMYDAMTTATHTEQPMSVAMRAQPVWYANQLPDPTEPFTDSRVVDFLNQLGRGNWLTIDRSSEPTLLGLLYQMNDPQNVNRSLGLSNANVGVTNIVHVIDADYPDDQQAIRRLFLATLTRYPTDPELAVAMKARSGPRYQWLSDLQWALLNKLDFAFNY